MKISVVCIAILLSSFSPVFAEEPAGQPPAEKPAEFKNPLGDTGPITPEEAMIHRAEVTEKATKILDSFVGTYRSECVIDGTPSIADLVIQPKFLDGYYYQGRYSLKPASGGSGYEAFNIFCFNGGSMSYLFFYFGNDGFIRNYLGTYKEGEIVVQSPFPGGMEYVRWRLEDENTLKQETWKPTSKNTSLPDRDADQIILFKRVK